MKFKEGEYLYDTSWNNIIEVVSVGEDGIYSTRDVTPDKDVFLVSNSFTTTYTKAIPLNKILTILTGYKND